MTEREIGQALRQRRKLLKATQKEIAELAECSIPTIVAAEAGKPNLRLTILVRICRVLGLELRLGERERGGD